jgi:16S rRNA (cytosine967-C5)-methyltransferase
MHKPKSTPAAPSPFLRGHAEALIAELLGFAHPADAALSHYFRNHKNLGQKDRAFLAETAFAVLRHWRTLSGERWPKAQPAFLLDRALHPLREGTPDDAEGLDLPDWLFMKLHAQYGEETAALARALNEAAPLDLRVNTLKTTRAEALAQLAGQGIAAEAGQCSPWAIRLLKKPALQKHPLFLSGALEVQDEGSQLVGALLAPKRGQKVADFCAGAGGKTLLLGMLMKSTGMLYAFDVSEKRMAHFKPRFARSGLSNVHPVRINNEHDMKVKRLAGKFDAVLVDAPCSGLGTLRRNPDLKWRQTESGIAELAEKQASILEAAAKLAGKNGRLAYATCSLLAEENEAIVTAFLARHPEWRLENAASALQGQGIAVPGQTDAYLRLLPHRQGCDGFFAALMAKAG